MSNRIAQKLVHLADLLDKSGMISEANEVDRLIQLASSGEDAYVYQAALLCAECGEKVREDLAAQGQAPEDPDDESSYDSDEFPKGPYADGGGEADYPNHCGKCNKPLENPLTAEGEKLARKK